MQKNKRLNAKNRMLAGFSVIILAIILILVISLVSISRIVNIQNQQDHLSETAREVTQLRADENHISSLTLEYILLESNDYDANIEFQIDQRMVQLENRISLIDERLAQHADLQGLFRDVAALFLQYQEKHEELRQLISQGQLDASLTFYRDDLKEMQDDLISLTHDIEMEMDNRLAALEEDGLSVVYTSQALIFLFGIVLIAISAVIIYILFNAINKVSGDLKEGISVLGESSAEIQTTVSEVSTGATETASSISETTTTVERCGRPRWLPAANPRR